MKCKNMTDDIQREIRNIFSYIVEFFIIFVSHRFSKVENNYSMN